MSTSTAAPIIRQAGEGERMWFAGGGVFTWKANAEETGGAFIMFEDHMERGKVTPLHTHPQQDEAIYVLDGEIVAHVEDAPQQRVGAGGLFFAPRGVPHAFMVSSETAHVLSVQTPGSGESFYREAGEPVTSDADATRPADFDRLRAVAERSDCIEILGPPPF
jgi:quercetin dioxygenase-like cupin family protein